MPSIRKFDVTAICSHVGVIVFEAGKRQSGVAWAALRNGGHDINDGHSGWDFIRLQNVLDILRILPQKRGQLRADVGHCRGGQVMLECP